MRTRRRWGGTHDVVVASFSLALDDIGPSLKKIDSAAKRSVHLFWFLTPPAWTGGANFSLWPRLHGSEFAAEPTADLLWNCLCQLGIYPDLTVEGVEKGQRYPTEEEAVADYCRRLYVRDDRQREIVASFVHERIVRTKTGFCIPGGSRRRPISGGRSDHSPEHEIDPVTFCDFHEVVCGMKAPPVPPAPRLTTSVCGTNSMPVLLRRRRRWARIAGSSGRTRMWSTGLSGILSLGG
ncbi:hypothetical protein [Methanoculleus chikugoensis]|uniref:hypothetical protein n=1 Tax=Methanoculleus chikugoensis TaxID=118126 RepID=UPI000A6199D3|nr:hypothetical protein [Methanoculleus chikugoensis]